MKDIEDGCPKVTKIMITRILQDIHYVDVNIHYYSLYFILMILITLCISPFK